MKNLMNTPETIVDDALAGMAAVHPSLQLDAEHRVIHRAHPKKEGLVGIISGGGSGHEPLHAGFVGEGMLDAACSGEVFTSPVPDQIMAAAKHADRGAGVLFIVKNYTGDVMNFEMAAELAAAESDIEIETVVIADDVAVEDSTFTAGRRGVGATVLVEKIAGAAAERGDSLQQVAEIARRAAEASRSMGMALTSVTVPANGKPSFDLPSDEVEIGIGIHGEPGRHREKLTSAAEITRTLMDPLLAELPGEGGVLLFVNGMGATPLLELYVVAKEAAAVLGEAEIPLQRSLVGDYITSLDMAGCSITLLRLDDDLADLWDAPASTPGLTMGGSR